jgi:hypothetical protein
MNKIKIPYYVVRNGRGYFQPNARLKRLGLALRALGPDGPAAWAEAQRYYEDWKRHGQGLTAAAETAPWPMGSIGHAFDRYRQTDAWKEKALSTRKKDWEWSWKFISPIFGDVDPATVQIEDIEALRKYVLERHGLHTANRMIKTWRALWKVMAAMSYCNAEADPSRIIRNTAPKGRSATWRPGELARIGKRAWREGYKGLAAILAVCWDTQFSPGDVRSLKASQLVQDARGAFFETKRGKTGRQVIGTLSSRSRRVVAAYLKSLGAQPMGDAAIFRNRSGQPYTSDTLGDDFRDIRALEFPDDDRKLLDIRRTGAIEALAGQAEPGAMAMKMGNSIDKNRQLAETYLPNRAHTIRQVDQARLRGRRAIREDET